MKNKGKMTPAKAIKMYTGYSISKLVTKETLIFLLLYFVIILFFFGMAVWKNGLQPAQQIFREGYIGILFFSFALAIFSEMNTRMMNPTRALPGGKFLRSVPAGFAVFQNIKLGQLIVYLSVSFLSLITIALVNMVCPFLKLAGTLCTALMVSVLLRVSVGNLTSMIPHDTLRSILSCTLELMLHFTSIALVWIHHKLVLAHLIMAAVALLLFPFSYHLMLVDYRKNCWN